MKKKRILAVCVVFAMFLQIVPIPQGILPEVLSSVSVSKAAAAEWGDVTWEISGGTLTITGKSASSVMTDANLQEVTQSGKKVLMTTAPWGDQAKSITTLKLVNVTTIGNYTFYECSNLESVTLSGVKKIGKYAFYNCSKLNFSSLDMDAKIGEYAFAGTGLTEVVWPENSTVIAEGVFQNCSSIATIKIPSQVTKIENNAFNFCSGATSITNLDHVTSIGRYVFSSCNQLTSVVWSEKVNTISYGAFSNCTGLTAIVIPDYITAIESSAFYSCTSVNTKVVIPGSVQTIGKSAFEDCIKISDVAISQGVKTIGDNAFFNCNKLETLSLPQTSLTEIGAGAFSSTKLSEFTIPASVAEIGVNPFVAGAFTKFKVESGNKKYSIENEILVELASGKADKVISYPGCRTQDAEVPATVTSIGGKAFQSTKVKRVTLPDGIVTMGAYAFYESALETVTIPKSLKVISNYAFYNTQYLTTITLQKGLEQIGMYAFAYSVLEEIEMPGTLLTIQTRAFMGASSLKKVDARGCALTSIEKEAFYRCGKLAEIYLSDDLEMIGESAFSSCTSLKDIVLPDKLRTIGNSVFAYCTAIESIVFPNSITTLGESVLSNCITLTSVDFGSKLQEISGNVFKNCPKLTDISISSNNSSMTVDENVLYNKDKTKLIYYAAGKKDEKFVAPDTIKTVGVMAINYCTNLRELRFKDQVQALGDKAIYRNNGINKIFFYGNAPTVVEHSIGSTSDNVVTYTYYNGSIDENCVSGTSYNNKGLLIFVLKESTGWENGWTAWSRSGTLPDTDPYKRVWDTRYTFDDSRWDPTRTDSSEGDFGNGLSWKYTDEVGELIFHGEGEIPDYTLDNLFTWTDESDQEWSETMLEPINHMQDIRLIETRGVTRIGNYAFYGASSLYRVLTGNALKEIGQSAFADCLSLEIIHIPNADLIEKESFKGDKAIKDELDVRGVKTIGEGAFKECTSLTEILLGENLTTLGKGVFDSCSALDTIMMPESIQSIGEGCFRGCSQLRSLNIPKSIKEIPSSCFADCAGLEKVYFYGAYPTAWSEDSFTGTNEDITLYYRARESSWETVGDSWNGIPVVALDKFYTEQKDTYSFSNSRGSFGYSTLYNIPLQRYVTAMQSITRGSFYHAWGSLWQGSCFGMASSSTEFYEGDKFDVTNYAEGAENLYDVSAPKNSDAALTTLIEIYQVSQLSEGVSKEVAENKQKYKKLIKQVEEFERSGGLRVDSTADPVVMCVYAGSSGHALVPVSVNMDAEGNYILEVYDCNYPDNLQTLKIVKDFSKIEYERYQTASFVKYSTIKEDLTYADFTGKHVSKQEEESTNVSVATNRENITLVNGGGRDYKEIKGAYEQQVISDTTESDTGSDNIRSFVLPQGEYHLSEDQSSEAEDNQEPLTYYVATEDLYSQIDCTDEDTVMEVKSIKGVGEDTVTLKSASADAKSDLTIMDVSGVSKEVSVVGSSVTVKVKDDKSMIISASEDVSEIEVDGEKLDLEGDNKATVSFYTPAQDNALKMEDMTCELSLDADNNISGSIDSILTWSAKDSGQVDVTATIKDEENNVIFTKQIQENANFGMQAINMELDKEKVNLGSLSEEFDATCEVSIKDSKGHEVNASKTDIRLNPTKKESPIEPSIKPTVDPSKSPIDPSTEPTADPSKAPIEPTVEPSAAPIIPSANPTAAPSTEKPSATQSKKKTSNDAKTVALKKGKVFKKGALKYIVLNVTKKKGVVAVYGTVSKNIKTAVIPKKVVKNGCTFKVTSIYRKAFANKSKLSSVWLGDNITAIGNNAFTNCKSLQFVKISKNVNKIGKQAFMGCKSLKGLLVKSNKIKSVGSSAFQNVNTKVIVKTSKTVWRKYAGMFMGTGKMSGNALFVINPVMLKYNGKSY